jgi:cytochrome c oxidase cbb3-type subunit III
MRQIIRISLVAVIASGIMMAQGPGRRGDPARSPASQLPPKTVTPQVYTAAQIRAGEPKYISQCGFCHGRDASGGEGGSDLTRSKLVAEDNRGDKIGGVVRAGRPDEGMPAFKVSDADLIAMIAFIHDQKVKAEALGGGRRSVEPEDLTTGNAEAGRRYFDGAGGCAGCHSATGDLKGVASKYQGLVLLQRMLYPSGRPAPARPKVTAFLASGQTVAGPLASEDEFTIVILDAAGARQTYKKTDVKFKIDDPMSAHFDLLGKYTDDDMHNVFAYLDTMK